MESKLKDDGLMRLPYAFIWLLFLSLTRAQCLHPNGSVTQDPWHAPCRKDSSDPLSTICCATERPGAPGTSFATAPVQDECIENGLCKNRALNLQTNRIEILYWREECTVKDWRSGKCLNVCTDDVNSGNRMMTPCDGTDSSETWCCSGDTTCCASTPIFIARRFGGNTTTASSSTSTSIASTASDSSTAPTSGAPTSNSTSSLGGGAIAGIVLGALVGLGLVFTAGLIIARKRRAKAQAVMPDTSDAVAFTDHNRENSAAFGHASEQKTYYAHEADALGSQVAEAPGHTEPHSRTTTQELP